ncbi:50S ribosomal protein L23 [Candidatus Falkowbacteria bacterium RIFOXYD2_FULL_35_9]|uniref:Large ribosomal subunit protein uL23 n=1 Tax=Candidatus Falkowbacteria bacterium RIFOXYC2_FULL_36_12 TaxID=1798002 RepID=A0A1F5SWC3_9BACT|nr:MAG: 50S ribosomal protein L23 [Candidatus Falkowbacteria bacterium RIFOXYB2_FULL_35_7]OGF31035.1 MAG: 50S ribosomal protein L23 [Candidatus Falkowbacteria bacterium RIFOXYC2_FULL_36_12]OGF34452.1 MAG: 50S ribosomal protein L23 [Candidatus Falkowbacteria bacterium RIFOXYA2_FULL_35_8]OGF47310.1 MAG: 50S ribosomal protein L23 [Candidatus Falkowbacteria bacterium RIFOXYD2_FULL_35_9]
MLERPLVTEKVTDLGAFKKYVFAVPTNATKNEVEKAVKSIYGVSPVKVNIVNVKGKMVRSGKKYGKRKDFRKAIVTLGGEDKIEIYEGV